jgi:hypothetical protein
MTSNRFADHVVCLFLSFFFFFLSFSFCISSLLMGIGKSFIQLFEKGGYNFAKIMCQICLALLHFDFFWYLTCGSVWFSPFPFSYCYLFIYGYRVKK